MIKLHSGVAVNPFNVVSVKLDGNHVVVFLWNGRVHKVSSQDAYAEFARIKGEISKHIDMTSVEPQHWLNLDAVVSIAKVEDGISINLVTGNRIFIAARLADIDNVFDTIVGNVADMAA